MSTRDSNISRSSIAHSLTESEKRKREALRKRQSIEWRNFWICVQNRRGYSNVQNAEFFGVSESTIRRVLKDKQ